MNEKIWKVGLVGLGFMGRMHWGCYAAHPRAQVVAVCDTRAENFAAPARGGNIEGATEFDLSGVQTYTDVDAMLADPEIEVVDLCLPTPAHADATIRALHAGKHVLCEKPMVRTLDECDAMLEAARASGKVLMIGHCLRFWPHYVTAHEMIERGELGRVLYARFHRSTEAPNWSRWMLDAEQSGGAVLDTHIHDVDTALWWFGRPDRIVANGVSQNGLSLKVDAHWFYDEGPQLDLHCGWDKNGGPFRMAFEIMGEAGTLAWDSALGETLQLHQNGETREIAVSEQSGYSEEIAYFLECIGEGRAPERATPQSSRLTTEVVLEEMRLLGARE